MTNQTSLESSANAPLIQLESVGLVLNEKSILTDIALKVERNQIITLIGPNGAGKTSLVRLILGLIEPTAGQIKRQPKVKLGYMPQKLQIDPFLPLTVKRFLNPGKQKNKNQKRWIGKLAIEPMMETPIQKVSGGEFQRILLARALLNEPDVLVLDEPVQGVDMSGQAELYALIRLIRDTTHCAVVLVSHDLHLVMAETDQVFCLNKHICCSGTPEQVTQHPAFIHLFGEKVAAGLAVYTHQHNHRHTLDGEITDD